MFKTILANTVKILISTVITLAVVLGLFDIFPMESTKPNHDMIIILFGFVIGASAFYYMEYCKMFEKKDTHLA